jgi:hypothetical protein
MAKDAFGAAVAGFRKWSRTATPDDLDELGVLTGMMRNDVGMDSPGELTPGDISAVLLEIYPRQVIVDDRADAYDTVRILHEFFAYLAETRELTAKTRIALDRQLDHIAHEFADAVMDDEGFDEELDLKEAVELPDALPPIRLPSDAELAAQARTAPMLTQLRELVSWVGTGRPIDEDEDLAEADRAAAVAAVGIGADRFDYLLDVAFEAELLEPDDEGVQMVAGESAPDLAGDDHEILGIWDTAFTLVLDGTLEVAADLDPALSEDLDFYGQGTAMAVMLFLQKADGIPLAAISEAIRISATDELPDGDADQVWQAWVDTNGDPARLLVDQLIALDGVRVSEVDQDGEVVRLSPLGLLAVRRQLIESDVAVPLLPPAAEMTAADLIAMAAMASEEELKAETAAWLAGRTPAAGAEELLTVAAAGDAGSRLAAVTIATELGAAAEPAWQAVLDRVELRPYARIRLAEMAGQQAELELAPDEKAWMITDALALVHWDAEEEEVLAALLAEVLGAAIPAGQEPEVFELIARAPHPDAADVLTAIGTFHPDKKVAKLARKCAYKAATRQASARS